MTTINPDYSVNSKTGRFVKKGSRTYSKMLKMGQISDNLPKKEEKAEEKVDKVEEKEEIEEIKPEIKYNDVDFKENLKKTMKDIIKENNKEFKGLSQKQTDQILKKLLYEKLCIDKPKPKKKQNNKSKLKFKIRSLDSSDESSEDDSNDE